MTLVVVVVVALLLLAKLRTHSESVLGHFRASISMESKINCLADETRKKNSFSANVITVVFKKIIFNCIATDLHCDRVSIFIWLSGFWVCVLNLLFALA